MPAKPTKRKPLNLLVKLAPDPADKLREIAASENRSASAQAKTILETALAEKP